MFFLFLALAAILFNRVERFEQFCWTVTYGTFLYNYFKIDALVKEEKSFKSFFSIFSSGGHLVQRSKTVLASLVDSHLRNIPVKLFQNLFTDWNGLSNFVGQSPMEHSCIIISNRCTG